MIFFLIFPHFLSLFIDKWYIIFRIVHFGSQNNFINICLTIIINIKFTPFKVQKF